MRSVVTASSTAASCVKSPPTSAPPTAENFAMRWLATTPGRACRAFDNVEWNESAIEYSTSGSAPRSVSAAASAVPPSTGVKSIAASRRGYTIDM